MSKFVKLGDLRLGEFFYDANTRCVCQVQSTEIDDGQPIVISGSAVDAGGQLLHFDGEVQDIVKPIPLCPGFDWLGEGYRLLEDGEKYADGDELWCIDGFWVPLQYEYGSHTASRHVFARRKVPVLLPIVEPGCEPEPEKIGLVRVGCLQPGDFFVDEETHVLYIVDRRDHGFLLCTSPAAEPGHLALAPEAEVLYVPNCPGWDWLGEGYELVWPGDRFRYRDQVWIEAGYWQCTGGLFVGQEIKSDFTAVRRKIVPSYADLQAAWVAHVDLMRGDHVKVIGKAESGERGWGEFWTPDMDAMVGEILQATGRPTDDQGVELTDGEQKYRFPWFVLFSHKEAFDLVQNADGERAIMGMRA